MRPEIPTALLDDLVRNRAEIELDPRHIRENNALEDADNNATAASAAEPTATIDETLLILCGDQLTMILSTNASKTL